MSNGLKSNPKIFADDISLFSVIYDVNLSQIDLNEDLDKINNWAYQWKMRLFYPSKKAQEVIFSRKVNNILHPPLIFNNVDVGQMRSQKHLVMFLDFNLSFNEHLENVLAKVNRGIAILHKFQFVLPRQALLIIYKSFIRSHFDYGDVIHDQLYHSHTKRISFRVTMIVERFISCSSIRLEQLRCHLLRSFIKN